MQMQERECLSIYVFGKKYEAPKGLTIQKAMEFAGYRFIRSCGCRGGICGACLTEYRVPGSYQVKMGLACQTLIEPDMQITQSPFFPMNRPPYHLEELGPLPGILGRVYPEIYRCLQCNTCTRVCPMDIQVMDFVAMAIQGEIEKVALFSFQCVLCGACASKCPAEISQPNVGLLARRLYGRHLLAIPEDIYRRISDIENGQFSRILERLTQMSVEELMRVYTLREQEPQEDVQWIPKNPNFPENIF
jgi:Fe-S oxidoreductase